MAPTICMIHPTLPGQPIYVDPISVDFHRKRGWKLCPQSTAPSEQDEEAPAPAPARRRSTKKEAN